MHYLDRRTHSSPACLATLDYREQRWADFDSDCKAAVREELRNVQQSRCAYCECALPDYDSSHIEHFRRKHVYPALTFAWQNLFLSCNSREHCGHFKDRQGAPPYDVNKLVKPDELDPDAYLYFSASGEVRPRSGCANLEMAEQTIAVFGLNAPPLRAQRRNAIKQYRQREELEELMTWSPEDRNSYLAQEIDQTSALPFCTTLRHFLETTQRR